MRKKVFVLSLGCALMMLLSSGSSAKVSMVKLADRDCAKCHPKEVKEIDAHGSLHKTKVGCSDCHAQHPPQGNDTIAACDRCHAPEEHAHYKIKNCKSCHPPHSPTATDLDKIDNVTAVCLSCHIEPGREMQVYPSKHNSLDCKQCHPAHRQAKECMQCHDPHSAEMTTADCTRCHKHHRPIAIKYDKKVPAVLCTSCHAETVTQVNARGAGHNKFDCIGCHKQHPPSKEGVIPACALCHAPADKPHYGLKNCAACHHPHYPLEMDFAKIRIIKPACLSCHPEPGREMQIYPGKHVIMDCKICHEVHREATACMQCHDAHSDQMNTTDCTRCHKPHRPMAIQYDKVVPAALCASCHKDIVAQVNTRGAGHKNVGCNDCHRQHPPAEEGVIPTCALCHAPPEKPHYGLENCAACHHPHYPMEMDLAQIDPIKPVCLSCHPEPGKKMVAQPSKHTELDCKECHLLHRESLACRDCHGLPHNTDIHTRYPNCLECHEDPHALVK
ncbi:MAG: hypothetical protein JW786_10870 [Desulfobacterales bacterium]|nr:hypothetical protein [Desulfobacterales bacterium]